MDFELKAQTEIDLEFENRAAMRRAAKESTRSQGPLCSAEELEREVRARQIEKSQQELFGKEV